MIDPDEQYATVGRAGRLASLPFIWLIRPYQITLSPIMGGQCRFEPTCSRYAAMAYRLHGPWRGSILTARRIFRCHPFGRGGYDPVPLGEREPLHTSQKQDEFSKPQGPSDVHEGGK